MKSFEKLREEYLRSAFGEHDADSDPFQQFMSWFDDALDEELPLANACALATATPDAYPSVRIVLLKGMGPDGFLFFSNYESRKGVELSENPRASLLFWWTALERQVRIEGSCQKAEPSESDEYFAQRPRASNLSAMASAQSRPVASRGELEQRVAELTREWEGKDLQRPDEWGGFRLVPERLEFWQGRADRLHDRLLYSKTPGGWEIERLCP